MCGGTVPTYIARELLYYSALWVDQSTIIALQHNIHAMHEQREE